MIYSYNKNIKKTNIKVYLNINKAIYACNIKLYKNDLINIRQKTTDKGLISIINEQLDKLKL